MVLPKQETGEEKKKIVIVAMVLPKQEKVAMDLPKQGRGEKKNCNCDNGVAKIGEDKKKG